MEVKGPLDDHFALQTGGFPLPTLFQGLAHAIGHVRQQFPPLVRRKTQHPHDRTWMHSRSQHPRFRNLVPGAECVLCFSRDYIYIYINTCLDKQTPSNTCNWPWVLYRVMTASSCRNAFNNSASDLEARSAWPEVATSHQAAQKCHLLLLHITSTTGPLGVRCEPSGERNISACSTTSLGAPWGWAGPETYVKEHQPNSKRQAPNQNKVASLKVR